MNYTYYMDNILQDLDLYFEAIAEDFENQIRRGLDTGIPPFIARMVLDGFIVPPIKDWWTISDGKKTFGDRHREFLDRMTEEERSAYRKMGLEDFATSQASRHFNLAAVFQDTPENPLLDTFLPHQMDYAYSTFGRLPGFMKLNRLCASIDLHLVMEINPKATNVNDAGSYLISLNFGSKSGHLLQQVLTNIAIERSRKTKLPGNGLH